MKKVLLAIMLASLVALAAAPAFAGPAKAAKKAAKADLAQMLGISGGTTALLSGDVNRDSIIQGTTKSTVTACSICGKQFVGGYVYEDKEKEQSVFVLPSTCSSCRQEN